MSDPRRPNRDHRRRRSARSSTSAWPPTRASGGSSRGRMPPASASSCGFACSMAPAQPVPDALVEVYQADAEGTYGQPAAGGDVAAFYGFGRLPTDADGTCTFTTIRPGAVRSGAAEQAPHVNVCLSVARPAAHIYTRIYFEGDPARPAIPILGLVRRTPSHAHGATGARPSRARGTSSYVFRERTRRSSSICDRAPCHASYRLPRDDGCARRGLFRRQRSRRDARVRERALARGGGGRRRDSRVCRRRHLRRGAARRIRRVRRSRVTARAGATPAIPLVKALRATGARRLIRPRAAYVHAGATSQDVTDTALILLLRRRCRIDRRRSRTARAGLARAVGTSRRHGHARPDAVAAGHADDVRTEGRRLDRADRAQLAATGSARGQRAMVIQLGGAAGTLAALGDSGPRVAEYRARELDLRPAAPWHTDRDRLGALIAAAGCMSRPSAKPPAMSRC